MADLVIPDISEFQQAPPLVGLQAVIIRAHNGYRADKFFAANRANAHAAGCKVIGIYQYLLGGIDPAAQARMLLQTVGALQPGEFLICDLEESSVAGEDERPRYAAWRAVVGPVSPVTWLYTFTAFAIEHQLTESVDWLAAYQNVEPSMAHCLWQFTDAYAWRWGRSDASVFHGTVDQLHALISSKEDPMDRVYVMHSATRQAVYNLDRGWKIDLGTAADGSLFTNAAPSGFGLAYMGPVSEAFFDAVPARSGSVA